MTPPQPDATPEPQPNAEAPTGAAPAPGPDAATAPSQPAADDKLATLLHTPLGEVLLDRLLKDPKDTARLLAAAISDAEGKDALAHGAKANGAAPAAPEATPKPGPEPDAKAAAAATPKVIGATEPRIDSKPAPKPKAKAHARRPKVHGRPATGTTDKPKGAVK
jgi:hypothetical protein